MIWIIIGLLLLVASAFMALRQPVKIGRAGNLGLAALLAISSIISFLATSFVTMDGDEVVLLKRKYFGEPLPAGHLIGTEGQRGYQSRIIMPPFHFEPFIDVIYDTTTVSMVTIPTGFYGQIEAMDGEPLPEDKALADPWPEEEVSNMLDAEYFLNNGGQKGLQTTVLKPGTYPLNLHLFRITVSDGITASVYFRDGKKSFDVRKLPTKDQFDTAITEVPAGFVGVVKSNVQEQTEEFCSNITQSSFDALAVSLVPDGCKGIWKNVLTPDAYYLNKKAYEITPIDTRVQTWTYRGGYERRSASLTVSAEGKITQDFTKEIIETRDTDADSAIMLKVEGWEIPQEVRVLVQVTPSNAPFVVAAVGNIKEVEDRILTPTIRSIARDVAGSTIELPDPEDPTKTFVRQTKVLDLIENRGPLQDTIEKSIQIEGRKAGINIKEVRLGEPSIPPELLVARQREQLATQLTESYRQEQLAQTERAATENARANADKQEDIVQAKIDVQISEQKKKEQENLGAAQKNYLKQLAEGQKAQTDVLGADRVAMLQALDKGLALLKERPELISMVGKLVPQTMVVGGGGNDLPGAAAILSANGGLKGLLNKEK